MKIILKILIFLSFISSALLILYSLVSLSEISLFGPRLISDDVEVFIKIAVGFLLSGIILVYIKNKIAKKSNYFE